MSSIRTHPIAPREHDVQLESGDRMSQPEFHRVYSKTPEDFKAELIGGIVYVASPLKTRHGNRHLLLSSLFTAYEANTPGVESGDNTTIILGDEGEPQPDLYLRILPSHGGQSRTTADDNVGGAPELVAEVAGSSRAIDTHLKRQDYTRYGVLEYLVWILEESKLLWIDLPSNRELTPPADGIIRLQTFPGFWIDVAALMSKDYNQLMAVLNEGLKSQEHQSFIERLRAAGPQTP